MRTVFAGGFDSTMTDAQSTICCLLVTASLLPLISCVIVLFAGRWLKTAAGGFATAMLGVSVLLSLAAWFKWTGTDQSAIVWSMPWIPAGESWFYLGALVDSLTIAMMAMVTLVSTLVHLYSIGYMKGDPRFSRFFAYLSLFTFSMLGIVMSNSLMMIFVFWELVGLTSYLLIGFWFEKKGPRLACKKAFVMNRIGDFGFLVGFGILFCQVGANLMLPAAVTAPGNGESVAGGSVLTVYQALTLPAAQGGLGIDILNPPMWLTISGLGLFCGAIGKSAQFPLHTWLPDAMEGPTPVSSIVHSATMVAAGVYLTGRIYPILTPTAHLVVASIGLITLVMAACMALVMTDIKRVLAYSTLSQLGYMILGLGAGAWAFALFHLITHAFFKCCLFQCSGSVINSMHHEQDMRSYGGLMKKMPITAACYAVCTLAIAGASIPFLGIGISGFYSKDGIIAGTIAYGDAMQAIGGWSNLFWLGPTVIAYVTVFYMARSFALTFLGKARDQARFDHAHEAPWTMWLPQAVLAFLALFSALPMFRVLADITGAEQAMGIAYVQTVTELGHDSRAMHSTHAFLLHGFGWIIAGVAGVLIYTPGMTISSKIAALPVIRQLYTWAYNKFYFDALYDIIGVWLGKAIAKLAATVDKYIVDGLVNLVPLLGKGWAGFIREVDEKIVDASVNAAADIALAGGTALRSTQSGQIRTYVLGVFVILGIVGFTIFITMMLVH